jgi:hypothetical protein
MNDRRRSSLLAQEQQGAQPTQGVRRLDDGDDSGDVTIGCEEKGRVTRGRAGQGRAVTVGGSLLARHRCVLAGKVEPARRLHPSEPAPSVGGAGAVASVAVGASPRRVHPEPEPGPVALGGNGGHLLLLFDAKVRLEHLDGALVDLVVRVLLQVLDLGQPLGLGDVQGHLVGPVPAEAGLLLPHAQYVLEALEGDGDDLGVGHDQQVAEGPDAPLLDQKVDLLGIAAGGGVADRPRRLLPDVELGVGEELDEGRDDVVLDDGLDLLLVSGGDVGDGPARLLPDPLLGGGQ